MGSLALCTKLFGEEQLLQQGKYQFPAMKKVVENELSAYRYDN